MIITIKSKEEIEGFKEAGKIAGTILKQLLKELKEGAIPVNIDELARDLCKKHNVIPSFLNYKGFPAAICFSKNNVMVHGIPDEIPLKESDYITIDFGVTIDGFIGDTADTICIGSESEMISACSNALYEAIKISKAGNKLSDIGEVIYNMSGNYSIPEGFGGHGIDRYILHSPPFISNFPKTDEDVTLHNGMILAIEPMYIDSNSNRVRIANDRWSVFTTGNSAHCEHTILVNDDNPIILTRR